MGKKIGNRKVKNAEVFDNLAKVPGRGTDAWANQSLKAACPDPLGDG